MKRTLYVAKAGIIATIYVILTWLASVMGLASGVIQCRFSEALCILPVFTSAAVPGVTIGCLISNLVTTGNMFDIVFGSLATLIGAYGAYLLRKGKLRYFASIPTVVANAVIIPFYLKLAGVADVAYVYTAVTVAIGEVISCTILGLILMRAVTKTSLEKMLAD